jgi:hypothetical protein
LLAAAAFGALAFDFKGESGGSTAQFVMVGICLVCAGPIVIAWLLARPHRTKFLFIATTAVVALGMVVAGKEGVPFFYSGRIVVNYVLFLAGVGVGGELLRFADGGKILRRLIVVTATISAAFTYFYATRVAGIALDEARYQLVSPVVVSLIAYLATRVVLLDRIDARVGIVAAVAFIPMILSVTRSYLISLAFAAVAVIACLSLLAKVRPEFRGQWKRKAFGFFAVGVAASLAIAVAVKLRPDVFERWEQRTGQQRLISGYGTDMTYVTRAAEALGIWERVTESPTNFVFGLGFGSFYHWSERYAPELDSIDPHLLIDSRQIWYPAHSAFTYSLFFGGLIGLAWQLWMYALPLWRGVRSLGDDCAVATIPELGWMVFGVTSIWLFLSQSLTSNPLGARLSAFVLGASIALTLSLADALATRRAAFDAQSPADARAGGLS